MSTILDALKKSEQERELGQVPNLKTASYPVQVRKNNFGSWLVLLTLFCLSGGLSYYYYSTQTPSPVFEQPVEEPSLAEATPVQGKEETKSQEKSAPIEIKEYIDIEDIKMDQRPTRVQQKSEDVVVMSSPPKTEQVPNVVLEESVADVDVPVLEALPLSLRQQIPPLSLDVHVYAEQPENRFIMLNKRHYSEGEETREGLVLEAVEPEGAILSIKGQRFRLVNRQ